MLAKQETKREVIAPEVYPAGLCEGCGEHVQADHGTPESSFGHTVFEHQPTCSPESGCDSACPAQSACGPIAPEGPAPESEGKGLKTVAWRVRRQGGGYTYYTDSGARPRISEENLVLDSQAEAEIARLEAEHELEQDERIRLECEVVELEHRILELEGIEESLEEQVADLTAFRPIARAAALETAAENVEEATADEENTAPLRAYKDLLKAKVNRRKLVYALPADARERLTKGDP